MRYAILNPALFILVVAFAFVFVAGLVKTAINSSPSKKLTTMHSSALLSIRKKEINSIL